MSKGKPNDGLLAELAAMKGDTPRVLAAVTPPPAPPVAAAPAAAPAKSEKPRRSSGAVGKGVAADELRTGVNLNGRAAAALKQIQAMLLVEGDGATTSAAICIALEYTAANLANNKAQLLALAETIRQHDKRRRQSA